MTICKIFRFNQKRSPRTLSQATETAKLLGDLERVALEANVEAENAALWGEHLKGVRVRLAAHEYPREIEFVDDLPSTATGKIIRKDLRQRG